MQISICEGVPLGVLDSVRAEPLPAAGPPALFRPFVALSEVWLSLISGQCFVLDSHYSEEQCFLVVERRSPLRARGLLRTRLALLQRILLGHSQKAVAIDESLAISTVALACSDCLRNMGKNHLSSRAPVLLAMAAHAAGGLRLPPARAQRVFYGNQECWQLSAPRPDMTLPSGLTKAEEVVTRLLVEGHPHSRIAELRDASPRTIANQLASAFRKLGISGRAELLASLIRAHAERASAAPKGSTHVWNARGLARRRSRERAGARRALLSASGART